MQIRVFTEKLYFYSVSAQILCTANMHRLRRISNEVNEKAQSDFPVFSWCVFIFNLSRKCFDLRVEIWPGLRLQTVGKRFEIILRTDVHVMPLVGMFPDSRGIRLYKIRPVGPVGKFLVADYLF